MALAGSNGVTDTGGFCRCVCGAAFIRFCASCMDRYGDKRVPAGKLSPAEVRDDFFNVMRPLAIPFFFRFRRFEELVAIMKPGAKVGLEDFYRYEAVAEGKNPNPMFTYPPVVPIPASSPEPSSLSGQVVKLGARSNRGSTTNSFVQHVDEERSVRVEFKPVPRATGAYPPIFPASSGGGIQAGGNRK